jgi:hypothetical protein
MIKWWIGLLIGIATMLIGYGVGTNRAKGMYKMCEELLDQADARLESAKEFMRSTMEELDGLRDELEN